jgi:hypothetical protein
VQTPVPEVVLFLGEEIPMLKDYNANQGAPDGGAAAFAALCGEQIKHVASDRRSALFICASGYGCSVTAVSDEEVRFCVIPPEKAQDVIARERERLSNLTAAVAS